MKHIKLFEQSKFDFLIEDDLSREIRNTIFDYVLTNGGKDFNRGKLRKILDENKLKISELSKRILDSYEAE